MINKAKLNFIIDALMFLCMMAIAGLAFLMKFILIPGKERSAKYGRPVELSLFSWDRHEWGTIHLAIGLTLLGLLALHIILHWKIIIGLFQKLIGNQKTRWIIAPVFVILSLFLLAAPIAVRPDIENLARGRSEHSESNNHARGEHPELTTHDYGHRVGSQIGIRGFMTLDEVARKFNVPIQYLKTHLGIPASAPDTEKLGRLKDNYNFTMSDVEEVIARYRSERQNVDNN